MTNDTAIDFETIRHIAEAPDVLALFSEAAQRGGLVNEDRNARLLYLALTTRLFQAPICVAVTGPSSGGKSFLVSSVLKFFPDDTYETLSAISEKALARWKADMRHKVLVVYELAGIAQGQGLAFIRTLISEGHIKYLVSVPNKKDGWAAELLERPGPTGLVMTTTEAELHNEDATRFLALSVDEGPEQIAAVLGSAFMDTAAAGQADFAEWHFYQRWLSDDPTRVTIPYAAELGSLIPPHANRLKRDVVRVRNLIMAHALIHKASRAHQDGAIVASLQDYAAVYDLVADTVSEAVGRSVRQRVVELVHAVRSLTPDPMEANLDDPRGVSQRAIAEHLGIDEAAISRTVKMAMKAGYLDNLETRTGRPSRLVLGEPLPASRDVLPKVDELAAAMNIKPAA